MTDKIEIEFTESKMADNHKNILSLYDIKYDYGESIHLFFTRFREIVAQNLKKTGYKDGSYELSQDEIISPTFEEIIFLWSLEKINPLVCQKVKQKFTDNQTINDLLREEIINFLSEKENFDEIQQRPSKDLCNKCKNVIIAKDDPEIKTNHNDDCSIYIKDEEIETLVEVSAELTSIKGVKDEYFQTNGTIMKNGDFKKDDDIFDPDYDPNLDFDDLENLVDNENALKAKSTKKDIIDCNLCGQKCRGQQRLNTHIQRKHNQIFSCRICGEKCHGLQNFKIHRKAGLK